MFSYLSHKMLNIMIYIPLQLIPSLANWNPFLQLHMKEPSLLAQFWAQPPLLVLHSLMSVEGKI